MRGTLAAVFALALLLSGCPRPPDQEQVVELEPMYFTILKKGNTVEVKNFDTKELFVQAERYFNEGRLARAKGTYLLIAEEGEDPGTRGLAWFNIALCETGLEKPGAALEAIDRAAPFIDDEGDRLHLELVKLQALTQLGEWEQVRDKAPGMLDKKLIPEWEAKIHMFLGQAHFQENDLERSQARYRQALDTLGSGISLQEQYGDRTVAEAYFRLGEVYRRIFSQVPFKLPVERMTIDMSDKLALMRQAEEHFLASVRTRNSLWSPRAGFEVASLYESFAMDLMRAEVPPELDELELQVYTEELNAKMLPLFRKAQNIHRNNVSMCKTYRFVSPYEEKSKEKIHKIQATIDRLTPAEEPSAA